MPLDPTGVWIYTEPETASPASTLLNRLANTVKDRVIAFNQRIAVLEGKINRTRLQQLYLNLAATASGVQVGFINVNRAPIAQRVVVNILGQITNAAAGVDSGLATTIDAPGTNFINVTTVVRSPAANAPAAYASTRTFDIPAGLGAITLRVLMSLPSGGTALGNFTVTAEIFAAGEY